MNASESLQDFIGVHQLLHDQFAEAQQPLSELDKCHYFREAVKTLPHIHHAIESYLVTHPLVGNQQYRELTTHVLQQAPNFAPTAASMGYAATTIVTTDVPTEPTSVTELLHSPAFAAIITAAVQKAAAPRHKNQPTRPAAAKKSGTEASKDRAYCYHHGYDSHRGVDCRHMRSNSFSSDKLAANTHMYVTGASTNCISPLGTDRQIFCITHAKCNLMQTFSLSAPSSICADTGSTHTLLRKSDAPYCTLSQPPLHVLLPNGHTIESVGICLFYVPNLPQPISSHVFPDDKLNTSLLSIAQL